MASIKVKFRSSVIEGHKGLVYYQIIHGRKVRAVGSGHYVLPDEWDSARSTVRTAGNGVRTVELLAVRDDIRRDVERLTRIVRRLENNVLEYTVDDVAEAFVRHIRESSLTYYTECIISRLRQNGNMRTAETYRSALNSFQCFLESGNQAAGAAHQFMLDCITPQVMEAFQAWHRNRGNTPNTFSFYARILRAIYNRAVEEGITEDRTPFRRVYTGVDKTVKRALPVKTVARIRKLELVGKPKLDYARDMFMLSFYLRGMSFIDMAYLKKSDLRNGYIIYRRRKTGQQLTIAWTPEMQAILDKYPPNPTQYLLPVIKKTDINGRYAYRNAAGSINESLKVISALLGIKIPLTMYVARHSWASAAKTKGIPLCVISEGMGHDSEKTTRIYLASLDTSLVDRANDIIIASL